MVFSRFTASQAGLVALTIGAISTLVGLLLYGADMGPNLVAEASGVLVEVALVLLVLDRLAESFRRREWGFAQSEVGRRLAATMVDVMRLFSVRWSPTAYRHNLDRYVYFVELSQLHFSDLRSNIEAFAATSQPAMYEKSRRIELRLSWLIHRFREKPQMPYVTSEELSVVRETMSLVVDFLTGANGRMIHSQLTQAHTIVQDLADADGVEDIVDPDIFTDLRMKAQNRLVHQRQNPQDPLPPSGIVYDIDHHLAVDYLAIDHSLLCRPRSYQGES
jgi:hypothetical protein